MNVGIVGFGSIGAEVAKPLINGVKCHRHTESIIPSLELLKMLQLTWKKVSSRIQKFHSITQRIGFMRRFVFSPS